MLASVQDNMTKVNTSVLALWSFPSMAALSYKDLSLV